MTGLTDTYLLRFVALGLDREIHFRVKKTTLFLKAMKIVSEKLGQPLPSLRFYFKKTKIKSDDTPLKLRMKTNDYIHVLIKNATNIREQAEFLKARLKSEKRKRGIPAMRLLGLSKSGLSVKWTIGLPSISGLTQQSTSRNWWPLLVKFQR